ncbi:hypothetical protein D6777_02560, partial [Candidatus Woesearchaeota archaeon]
LIDNGFFTELNKLPICSYVINKNGFEKYYITSRRPFLKEQTIDWLENHGIDFEHEKLYFVGTGSEFENIERFKRKAYLAKQLKLDCFIEDEGEVAYEIAMLEIPVILFNYPWNQHISHKNIYRVGHWNDKCSYWRETENILKKISLYHKKQ